MSSQVALLRASDCLPGLLPPLLPLRRHRRVELVGGRAVLLRRHELHRHLPGTLGRSHHVPVQLRVGRHEHALGQARGDAVGNVTLVPGGLPHA